MEIFKEKQKKYKEKTNNIQTHIHLIFNHLRTFAYNNIVFLCSRKKFYNYSKLSITT